MANLAFSYQDTLTEAGCDEAGRGCLAGPVFAAAVILDPKMDLSELNDSKKLSAKKREELREIIEEGALAWAVAQLSPAEIDKHNILQASFLAMHRALDQLSTTPQLLLIDGNRFRPYKEIPHHCMIKGDGRFLSIAAASILAKTHRDEYMLQQAEKYPEYSWSSNKGYPTKAHRAAIAKFGATPLHRKSFRLLPEAEQKKLSFEDKKIESVE
ncbi:ribonuclease HII [Saprospira grandis DSM 2844]|uniref:Ribonuclease HII n=1 Tax=Saprospira grandis DSM 2844 TaxID=694433 RepID=J0NZ33_9BACT|nr:ribonuclease HII [Saprospira grandis]EJF52784.1 ribonuclease HII [Saprospira grandis DSM 2844]